MEIGTHQAHVINHEIRQTEGGAVLAVMQVKFDNGETSFGQICMVKKDGSPMEKNIKDVQRIFGWNDGNIEALSALTYEPIEVTVTVHEEEYQGRTSPKINNIWPARRKADPAAAAMIGARFGNLFKQFATTTGIKPLSAQPAFPPVQTPAATPPPAPAAQTPAPAPAAPKKGKKEPSVATLEKFLKVFADVKDEDTRNAYFYDLIGQVLGDQFDMDKATKEQWKQVYDKIEAFHKEMEAQIKQLNTEMPSMPATTEEDVFA